MTSVAVVIPTYRRPQLLLRAIRSAFSAERAGIEVQVTVVDNHSPEDVAGQVRAEFGDRVAICGNGRNLGLTGNWNRCREIAQSSRADFWLLLEDDNFLEETFFERTLAVAAADPGVDVVYSACYEFDDAGHRAEWRPWSVDGGPLGEGRVAERELLAWAFTCPIRISAMLVRNRQELVGLPQFSEEHFTCQDVSGLMGLVLTARAVAYLPAALMAYYVNPKSVTASVRADGQLVLSEMMRAFRHNVDLLLATGRYALEDWRCVARNAPVDRLLISTLSLSLAPRAEVGDLRRAMVQVLVSRSGELGGLKGLGSRVLGGGFWALAGLRARQIGRRRRESSRTADFDAGTP